MDKKSGTKNIGTSRTNCILLGTPVSPSASVKEHITSRDHIAKCVVVPEEDINKECDGLDPITQFPFENSETVVKIGKKCYDVPGLGTWIDEKSQLPDTLESFTTADLKKCLGGESAAPQQQTPSAPPWDYGLSFDPQNILQTCIRRIDSKAQISTTCTLPPYAEPQTVPRDIKDKQDLLVYIADELMRVIPSNPDHIGEREMIEVYRIFKSLGFACPGEDGDSCSLLSHESDFDRDNLSSHSSGDQGSCGLFPHSSGDRGKCGLFSHSSGDQGSCDLFPHSSGDQGSCGLFHHSSGDQGSCGLFPHSSGARGSHSSGDRGKCGLFSQPPAAQPAVPAAPAGRRGSRVVHAAVRASACNPREFLSSCIDTLVKIDKEVRDSLYRGTRQSHGSSCPLL